MTPWMQFLLAITGPLWDLFEHLARTGNSDPELEKQIAMRIIRAAKDAQARREFGDL